MAIKFKFKTREEIPAEHQSLYVERDGAWLLDADGVVEKTKLDEFRNTNLTLTKERDELKRRFDGIDPDEVRKLADEKRALELKAQGHKPEEIEKIVEGRIKTLRGELEKQVSSLSSERDALTSRLTAIQIDQGVITVATKRGLRPTAIPDITSRARMIFKLVNGAPRAFEADGQTVRYPNQDLYVNTIARDNERRCFQFMKIVELSIPTEIQFFIGCDQQRGTVFGGEYSQKTTGISWAKL